MFRIDRSLVNMEAIKENIAEKNPNEAVSESDQSEKPLNVSEERLAAYADETIKQAALKARTLIQEAEEQALVIKRISRQKGYEEGLSEAGKKFEKALEEAREQDRLLVARVVSELEKAKQNMLDNMEGDIIGLVIAIVRKIFDQTSKSDSSMLESMITNALKHIKKEGKINVRVSKEEYERFFSAGDASFVSGDRQLDVSLVPDEHMKSGDCIIECEGETVNAGLDSQLKNIEDALRQGGEIA